jgi:threonine aldolase
VTLHTHLVVPGPFESIEGVSVDAPTGFGSDNHAGVHPELLSAIIAANDGHVHAYGNDEYTRRAERRLKETFGDQAESYLMFNGTGANVAGLAAIVKPWGSVICAAGAHVNADESSAPERFIGCRLWDVPTTDGKLTPQLIERHVTRVGDVHSPQVGAVVISQTTEYGTVYSVDDVKAIADVAHAHGLAVYMDGARLSNAAAALGVEFREFTTDAGVDVVSFGGTKIGMMFGEAVVFLNPDLGRDFGYVRKQAMQLNSKMRFVACQFDALLSGDLWWRNATHANSMARRLEAAVRDIPGVTITQSVDANVVFATLPREHIATLQDAFSFYVWNEATSEVRWMCAWDTTEADVDNFAATVRSTLTASTRNAH